MATALKKIVVSVEICCEKCRRKVMKIAADIEGVNSITLDVPKNTVTVIGDADPVKITVKMRKFRRCARIVSVQPHKTETPESTKPPEPDKPDPPVLPQCCQRCEIWYFDYDDIGYSYNACTIL